MRKKEKGPPLTRRAIRLIWFGFFIGFIVGVLTFAVILTISNSVGK